MLDDQPNSLVVEERVSGAEEARFSPCKITVFVVEERTAAPRKLLFEER